MSDFLIAEGVFRWCEATKHLQPSGKRGYELTILLLDSCLQGGKHCGFPHLG